MKEKWFIKAKKGDFEIIGNTFHIDPVVAQLIVNRGINSRQEMEDYLKPSLKQLHNPLQMKDLEKACGILKEKVDGGKRIRVIGDYDVDGVMATYVLVSGLTHCGAAVDYEIPDRIRDGYGVNVDIIRQAAQDGVDTILTCDNGIAAGEAVRCAKDMGMTVIVTDHHDIPLAEGIPPADAVVNPKQEDCAYPYKGICGALVAYKLIEVLYDKFRVERHTIYELLEYAAIATVCDVMALKNENRILVKFGLEYLQQTKNIGLQALQEECGLLGKKLNAYHLGFVIGPCINASGRLESAKLSLKLLLSKDRQEAVEMAKKLKELNDERKRMTEENLAAAIETVDTTPVKEDKVLVVHQRDCHESLAGIIAGRLRERYNKPTLVLTGSGEHVKGSGRSIEEYHMFEELSQCRDLLLKFGGHPMAAGLSLTEDKIETLRQRLNQGTRLTEDDLTAKVSFDMVLPLEKTSLSLIRQMECLEPYGKGNEKPAFALKDVEVVRAHILGSNQNVLKLSLRTAQARGIYTGMIFHNIAGFSEAVDEKFGQGAFEALRMSQRTIQMDIVYQLSINEYNGLESVQLMIQNYR